MAFRGTQGFDGANDKDKKQGVEEMRNLKIGQKLDAYNDGKISPSRLAVVVVDDIIYRSELSKAGQNLWRRALKKDFQDVFEGCSFYCGPRGLLDKNTTKQFWDWNCNEFIVGHILNDKRSEKDPMLFAKRPDGFGWYSVNWNYSLDITGGLRRKNIRQWKICAEEMNQRMEWNAKEGRYDYYDIATGKQLEI